MISWIPLESNPEVFNGWANKAGLEPSSAQFYDVYGLDPELLSMVPRPVKAVILVFPYAEALPRLKAENERFANEASPKVDGSVFWMKQTIGNACGAMALMHALANTDVTLTPSSALSTFFASPPCAHPTTPSSALARADLFASTPAFAAIHAAMCNAGQSVPARADGHPDGAYTCFVNKGGRVIELDGGRGGAIDRGECTELLEDVARLVREMFMKGIESDKFSLMYLGQPMSGGL